MTTRQGPTISEKAAEILKAAWDGEGRSQGLIIFQPTIGNCYLIAGNQQWEFLDDNRLAAEYEEAIQELDSSGFARWIPDSGYRLTAAGFRLGDILSGITPE